MNESILNQIPSVDLNRILKDRSNEFHGPFDNIDINGRKVNNLFIRNKNGKIQLTDNVPYKISGLVIDPVNRNRLANKRGTNSMYIPTARGAVLISVDYPYKLKLQGELDHAQILKIKEEKYKQIKRFKYFNEIQSNLSEVFHLLDKKDRKVFSDKIRDRMRELIEIHNLEQAKGTKKSMVTLSDETVRFMKSVVDKERTVYKDKDVKEQQSKKRRKDLDQSISTKLSKGIDL